MKWQLLFSQTGGNTEEWPGHERPRAASEEAVTWLYGERLSWLFLEGKESVDLWKGGEHLCPPNHAIGIEHAYLLCWDIADATAMMYMGWFVQVRSVPWAPQPVSMHRPQSHMNAPTSFWKHLQSREAGKKRKVLLAVLTVLACDEAGLRWWIRENWWSHRWENCCQPPRV